MVFCHTTIQLVNFTKSGHTWFTRFHLIHNEKWSAVHLFEPNEIQNEPGMKKNYNGFGANLVENIGKDQFLSQNPILAFHYFSSSNTSIPLFAPTSSIVVESNKVGKVLFN